MKRFSSLFKNQSGFSTVIMMVILVPLFILITAAILSIDSGVTASDYSIQQALDHATKAAATCMNANAQAHGIIRINSDLANSTFKTALAQNLGLDTTTLEPSSKMYVSAPKYWLVVYNGYNDYTGALPATLYYFNGSSLTASDFSYGGVPYSFAVTDTGILVGAGGSRTVKLDTPGVIALMEIDVDPLLGGKKITVHRWSAARIYCENGVFKVN